MPIPHCPENLSGDISDTIHLLGKQWAASDLCPKIQPDILEGWDRLLNDWIADNALPLIIRKGGIKGSEVIHSTGRSIILADNSSAQWACHLALLGTVPTLKNIRDQLSDDEIPMAFAIPAAQLDHVKFRCTLGQWSVNTAGWKLCHIKPVGLNNRAPVEQIEIETLKSAFFDLMRPSNHFLLPKKWGGLGEV